MREIVFISRNISATGGVQGQISQIAKSLYERRVFRPVLICADNSCDFAKWFAEQGFEVIEMPMGKMKIFSSAKKIVQALETRDVAFVQSHIFRESLIGRAVRRKMPNIRHILRAQTYIDGVPKAVWKRILYHFIDGITSRWVDRYIANGKYMADEIIEKSGVNSRKVRTIIDGTPPIGTADEPVKNPQEPLPAKVAMVANFRAVKGHDCLVKALALLKQRNLIITARLIGSEGVGNAADEKGCNITEETKKLAGRLGVLPQLEFYGSTKNVCAALEGVSVVVLPANSSEGTPNCILEAMSVRKLVIASEMNGVGEIIEHGRNGLLHKPKDYIGFADCLEKVFTTPAGHWEDMRNAALQSWREKFTLDSMIKKLVDIYRELGPIDKS